MSDREVGGTLKNNKGEAFMKKAEREKCWGARDKLWECLRKHDEDETSINKCMGPRNDYTEACPSTWVTHFDRKFHFEEYKKQLYKDGLDTHDDKFAAESSNTKSEQ